MIIHVLLILAGLISISRGQQLEWETEEQTIKPSPADMTVVAGFRFKNIGKADVKFMSANSSCGCMKVSLGKTIFSPGESGEVKATFTIGVRTGLQEKVILVESNDMKRQKTALKMKVDIPVIAQIRPSFLFWLPLEALKPKEIDFKVMNGFPVTNITVESSNPKVTAKVEPVNSGQDYKIIVTPSETDQQIMAILSIKTDFPTENPKTFYAHVRVQPKK